MAFIDTLQAPRATARREHFARIAAIATEWVCDMLDGIGAGDATMQQQAEFDARQRADLPTHHPAAEE